MLRLMITTHTSSDMIKVLVYTCGGVSEKNPIKECLVCLSNLDKLQLHITTRDRSFNLLVEFGNIFV